MPTRLSAAVLGVTSAFAVFEMVLAVLAPGTSLAGFVAILVVSFAAGAGLHGRRRNVALGLLTIGTLTVGLSTHFRADVADEGLASAVLTPVVIALAPALAGALVGRARRQAVELCRLTVELAAERDAHAAAAVLEERTRIARELHDVISHSVSQMVVQAGAAEQLLAPDAPARAALGAIRVTGRRALTELRDQLGVLRDAPDPRPRAVPTLDDVRDLTGADVLLEYDDEAVGHVPAGPGLAAYRVVQEALTNARRHADGASVCVRIRRDDDLLSVDVVNGPGRRNRDVSLPGAGHGLTGMRERVDLYAGELQTFGTDDGGWRVHARLPLGMPA